MSHLDALTIVALRDGEPVDAAAHRHAEECAACRASLADASVLCRSVASALDTLTPDVEIDMVAAKAAVRRRLDARRDAVHRKSTRLLWSLGRAAVLLLVATGVAYAFPGSPLREWLSPRPTLDSVDAPSATGAARSPSEAIDVGIPPDGLRVVLTGLPSEATVEVRWIEGTRATIVAPPGSRYTVSEGRAAVGVTTGPVIIAVPRDGPAITIEVDERMIFRRVDGALELSGEVVSRSADRIVFSIAER